MHGDGHYNSAAEPDEPVIHVTQGYSRDHRPDLNQVMLDLIVEHQAGIPVLMKPLRGNTSDASDFGPVITQHIKSLQTAHGFAYLGADGALYTAEHLQKLAHTSLKWITRVPATLHEVQEALAKADPKAMVPLMEGDRYQRLASSYGGMAQRWGLIHSEHRRPQAQHTVEKSLLTQSTAEGKAFQKLCRTMFACAADAQQALATLAPGLQATSLHAVTIRPQPRAAKRGRPGKAMPPDEQRYYIEGALASSFAVREALVMQHSCFMLATNALDDRALSPQALLDGDKGSKHAERGFRFLKDPRFLASALYLKKPTRFMALLLVMTVCLRVYAALEYRIRTTLKAQQTTFPNQTGQPVQNPTARWVFQYVVGIHLLLMPGKWPLVLNRTAEHQHLHLLQLLGRRYEVFYS